MTVVAPADRPLSVRNRCVIDMRSPLFWYLDWNQSWMMQIAEVYDIQIDLNSKWLWHFRLINSFHAYHHFLLKHSLSKLNSLIKAWTCLIFPTFSEITESLLKSHSISKILTLLLFIISTKHLLEISFLTTTKSLLTLMFGVLFNLLALVRTRHFCIHLQAMLSRSTLPVSLTKDYGHFFRKGPNTDFHPGLILLSAGVLSRKHFRLTVNDGVRRKASECMPLTTGKWIFIRPSSDGTYYGMVMSVRPSVRPGLRPSVRPSVTVFRTFLLHALTYWSEILCIILFLCT